MSRLRFNDCLADWLRQAPYAMLQRGRTWTLMPARERMARSRRCDSVWAPVCPCVCVHWLACGSPTRPASQLAAGLPCSAIPSAFPSA